LSKCSGFAGYFLVLYILFNLKSVFTRQNFVSE
jgi:hypothetical protein